MAKPMDAIKLHGFNNLTKSLAFNIYDVCYAETEDQKAGYIEYIDEVYNAERLTRILTEVASIIDAHVLNVARQDYDPQGASVTMLVAEAPTDVPGGLKSEAVVGHLDKSHITVHTYPESHPNKGVTSFRADIDVSTCGLISPLTALDYLIRSFDSDIVFIDYRVRGFTRDVDGHRHFIDHRIDSIQDYIAPDLRQAYAMEDVNMPEANLFLTKMMLSNMQLNDYLFGIKAGDLPNAKQKQIIGALRSEMEAIFRCDQG